MPSVGHMADIDREMCRKAAAECVELARATSDPVKKEVLLTRAQEWLKLAYAKNDAEFERHLAELNDEQMTRSSIQRTSMQRQPMQQQPMQQQQAKSKPEDD